MFEVGYLAFAIVAIVIATVKFKLHPFLTLLVAAIVTGFAGQLEAPVVVAKVSEGFGNTLRSIGIVVACGTIIGLFLERSGGAAAIAASILRRVGEGRAPLAMNLAGYVISIPVFCDSGFVIMAPVNRALVRRTGVSRAVLAVALATGMYSTHVFVPPTPGPLAAAGELGVDMGLVILVGLPVALVAALAGLAWALLVVARFAPEEDAEPLEVESPPLDAPPAASLDALPAEGTRPVSTLLSYAVLILPILLIAAKSTLDSLPTSPSGEGGAIAGMVTRIVDTPLLPGGGDLRGIIAFLGEPVIAILLGVAMALRLKQGGEGSALDWVSASLVSAGTILLITGAGGSFGAVLRETGMGDTVARSLAEWEIGILLPFVIAAVLKTAQGSSTVAMITTAAIVSPLLPAMGYTSPLAEALVVAAIGAGAMTVSHVNDSYFWVVAQFTGIDTATALRSFTSASLVQGLSSIVAIALGAYFLV